MFDTLSEPVTVKDTAHYESALYRVGSSRMQGWSTSMEDFCTILPTMPDDPTASFFAVYDGHGGAAVAEYASKHLHQFVFKQPENKDNIENALKQAFLEVDKELHHNYSEGLEIVGSTAVVVLIKDGRLFCANAGDSRAIACVNGQIEVLSSDHKPNDETEAKRIQEAGGWIENDRVNGNLALSRALGDFIFKRNASKSPQEQIITAHPDVETRLITEDWEFIVLASDGIWDVLTNQQVVDFCRRLIGIGICPERICEELLDYCLRPDKFGTEINTDNMTVVLVCLLHNRTYRKLSMRCFRGAPIPKFTPTDATATPSNDNGAPLEMIENAQVQSD